MNRAAIITLAGLSSRFSKSVGKECHKSLFRDEPGGESLLSWQLKLLTRYSFSQIVLVGGYRHGDLARTVHDCYPDLPITLVYNDRYADLGSCYSLCLGVDALNASVDAVVFMEGDLLFDAPSFENLISDNDDAITVTRGVVEAQKSVAFYVTETGSIRYAYDPRHALLRIDEPFVRLGNSGQVWQFADAARLKAVVAALPKEAWRGTNFVPIESYFKGRDGIRVRVCPFEHWFNCNTISDYRAMKKFAREVDHE